MKLTISFTDRQVDLIDEQIDLAVRIGPTTDSSSLMTRKLGDQQTMLCAAPDYLADRGAPSSLDDLAEHDCILCEHHGGQRPWRLRGDNGQVVDYPVRGQLTISHGEALLDAVLAGHGIARLSNWLIQGHVDAGRLIRVLPSADLYDCPISLIWPAHRVLPPKIRLAADALITHFTPKPPWVTGAEIKGQTRIDA